MRIRARSRAAKLCLGRRLFTTRPSRVMTFRTHCICQFGRSRVMVCLESTHIIHVAPLFRLCLRAGDSSETSEEPLGHGIHGVHGGLVGQLWSTRANVEAQKVLHGGEVGAFNTALQPAFSGVFFVWKRQSLSGSFFLHFSEVPSERAVSALRAPLSQAAEQCSRLTGRSAVWSRLDLSSSSKRASAAYEFNLAPCAPPSVWLVPSSLPRLPVAFPWLGGGCCGVSEGPDRVAKK